MHQNQFFGSPTEDPNLHVSNFLRLSGTVKANQEAVRLHLFPFSLGDRASAWFHSSKIGSITSWDQMRRAFLTRFFPLSKTAQLRARLFQFAQKDEDTTPFILYNNNWKMLLELWKTSPKSRGDVFQGSYASVAYSLWGRFFMIFGHTFSKRRLNHRNRGRFFGGSEGTLLNVAIGCYN